MRLNYLRVMDEPKDEDEEFEIDNVADYGGWFDTHPEELPADEDE